MGLTDALQCNSPYFSSKSYKMYQLRRTYMDTHSFSRQLPSQGKVINHLTPLGCWQGGRCPPHMPTARLWSICLREHQGPGDAEGRVQAAGEWDPWGRVVQKHSPPRGQRQTGRQQERGEEFPLGLSSFMSVFPHVLAG